MHVALPLRTAHLKVFQNLMSLEILKYPEPLQAQALPLPDMEQFAQAGLLAGA